MKREEKKARRDIVIIFILLIACIIVYPKLAPTFYEWINRIIIYNNSTADWSLWTLTVQHVQMSVIGCLTCIVLGSLIGVFCTTLWGKEFRTIIEKLMSLSQSVSSIGLIALLIPIFGFGIVPGAIVLVITGMMPIVFSTMTGLDNTPPELLDAGRGLGMSSREIFWQVKVASAIPVILAGIRTTSIINIGCATLTAISGSGGLGILIFTAGIRGFDPVKLLEGTIPVTLLALLVDRSFELLEMRLTRRFSM